MAVWLHGLPGEQCAIVPSLSLAMQGRIQDFGKGGGGGGGGGGSDKYNTYTSRDIRITRACMDSDEKIHSSQCYGSYCSAIKFVTQSFCEFVTEACTWPSTSYMSVYKRLIYVLL